MLLVVDLMDIGKEKLIYWDIAAGIIILKEAGGFIDFFEEDTKFPLKKNILASNSIFMKN